MQAARRLAKGQNINFDTKLVSGCHRPAEARALKLEGEVLLEVVFTASGKIQVVRVVRGLLAARHRDLRLEAHEALGSTLTRLGEMGLVQFFCPPQYGGNGDGF